MRRSDLRSLSVLIPRSQALLGNAAFEAPLRESVSGLLSLHSLELALEAELRRVRSQAELGNERIRGQVPSVRIFVFQLFRDHFLWVRRLQNTASVSVFSVCPCSILS